MAKIQSQTTTDALAEAHDYLRHYTQLLAEGYTHEEIARQLHR